MTENTHCSMLPLKNQAVSSDVCGYLFDSHECGV